MVERDSDTQTHTHTHTHRQTGTAESYDLQMALRTLTHSFNEMMDEVATQHRTNVNLTRWALTTLWIS